MGWKRAPKGCRGHTSESVSLILGNLAHFSHLYLEKQFMIPRKRLISATLALSLLIFASACTPKPFLKVQYQLPPQSNALKGEKVALTVSDMRNEESILTETAKNSLKEFDGTFSMVVVRDDGSGDLIGVYDLDSFLTEVFQQRLKNEGIQVVKLTDVEAPELKIEIIEFQLDLVGRKWIVSMNYRANLLENGGVLSKESVSGQAERLKVRAKSDAEKILSELLSDIVNKLNLVRLFQQAR
jgi:hypothetical protein